ncbi:MAG: hypothetical protein Q7K55_06665 [Candidatus Levybacteria bacterium]|nr:hypothetical protein [Candidatus Levybacteria bacterium]
MSVENGQIPEGPSYQEVNASIIGSYEDIGKKRRDVYSLTFDDSKFKLIFYSPNEIPAPLPHVDNTLVVADQPKIRKQTEWEQFLADSAGNRNSFALLTQKSISKEKHRVEQNSLVVVESSPLSMVHAAQLLQPENKSLARIYQSFLEGGNNPLFYEFIDQIVAGKFIDSDGNFKAEPDYEGEILMFRSLLGDQEAAMEIKRRKDILAEKDKARSGNQEVNLTYQSETGLNLDDLIAVHVTEYLPTVDSNGRLYIKSLYDGSGKTAGRSTIHFTLNHHVASHSMGHWEKKPYVVLTPLRRLIEANEAPVSMRAEDTFFITSPGQTLVLPEETILVVPKEEVIKQKIRAKVETYNKSHLSFEDLQMLANHWQDIFWGEYYTSNYRHYDASKHHIDFFGFNKYTNPDQFDSLKDYIKIQFLNIKDRFYSEKRYREREQKQTKQPEKKRIIDLSRWPNIFRTKSETGNSDLRRYIEELVDINNLKIPKDELEQILSNLEKKIQEELSVLLKKLTVNKIITQSGRKVRDVDPQYVFDLDSSRNPSKVKIPEFVLEAEELAKNLGISTVRDPKTPDFECAEAFLPMSRTLTEDYSSIMSREESIDNFNEIRKDIIDRFSQVLPQTRRMYYLLGAY